MALLELKNMVGRMEAALVELKREQMLRDHHSYHNSAHLARCAGCGVPLGVQCPHPPPPPQPVAVNPLEPAPGHAVQPASPPGHFQPAPRPAVQPAATHVNDVTGPSVRVGSPVHES
jgi:hypothetical protein